MKTESFPILLKASDINAILDSWLDAYPEECFPPNGVSVDCASARMARHILTRLKAEVEYLINQQTFS